MTETKKSWTPERVAAQVQNTLVDQLGVDDTEVTPQSTFSDDLGADSLDYVEIIMAFEEDFDIEIPDSDVEKFTTVKQVTDYLVKRLCSVPKK